MKRLISLTAAALAGSLLATSAMAADEWILGLNMAKTGFLKSSGETTETAVDIAVQTKLLGAEDVTLVYRRGQDQMKASVYEQQLANIKGVKIVQWAMPAELISEDNVVRAIRFDYATTDDQGKLVATGEQFELAADMVFKAIGQKFINSVFGDSESPDLNNNRMVVGDDRKTSLSNVWAGGDCIDGGEDLTVAAVEDGKVAAMSIDQYLKTDS